LHDYFQQYKGRGDYRLRSVFAGSLRRVIQQYSAPFLFVPIPTSPSHFAQRQFDPVVGLYGDILPLTRILTCQDHEDHQAQLTRRQRLHSPQYFYCDRAATPKMNLNKSYYLMIFIQLEPRYTMVYQHYGKQDTGVKFPV
jgi:Predicted amidophosphoribosyltransferases